ncbi:hypothetical protein KSP39_PZI023639 [Platanthera zijinensis]|uniref:Mitotic-spindle organizing protein 1 n=1 Tax=Platanthera zijinensis TaxID=2320716 RepID=A0AAP0AUB0_9ASPA
MEATGGQIAKETLELAFQISNMLETGLDRHTLSLLIALIDRGINPEPLSAVVRELSSPPSRTQPSSAFSSSTKP